MKLCIPSKKTMNLLQEYDNRSHYDHETRECPVCHRSYRCYFFDDNEHFGYHDFYFGRKKIEQALPCFTKEEQIFLQKGICPQCQTKSKRKLEGCIHIVPNINDWIFWTPKVGTDSEDRWVELEDKPFSQLNPKQQKIMKPYWNKKI